MDADDRLRALWLGQSLPALEPAQLLAQVRRYQWRLRLKRALELAITLAALLWFALVPLWRAYTPVEWLQLPFFGVFLPVVWSINLRRRHTWQLASESSRVYAGLRLVQLRDSLRELRLADGGALALLTYAVAVQTLTALRGHDAWFDAATALVVASLLWTLVGRLYVNAARARCHREYRNLRRLRR